MPNRNPIIIIAVLSVLALGLGYVYGTLGGDVFFRRLCIIIGLLVVCIGVIYGVLQDVFSGRSRAFLTFCIALFFLYKGDDILHPPRIQYPAGVIDSGSVEFVFQRMVHRLYIDFFFVGSWLFFLYWVLLLMRRQDDQTNQPMFFGFKYQKLFKFLGNKTECKWCKETIKADALVCKHCGTMLKDDEAAS